MPPILEKKPLVAATNRASQLKFRKRDKYCADNPDSILWLSFISLHMIMCAMCKITPLSFPLHSRIRTEWEKAPFIKGSALPWTSDIPNLERNHSRRMIPFQLPTEGTAAQHKLQSSAQIFPKKDR